MRLLVSAAAFYRQEFGLVILSSHLAVETYHFYYDKNLGKYSNFWLRSTRRVDIYSPIRTPVTTLVLQITEIKKHKRSMISVSTLLMEIFMTACSKYVS